MRQRLVSATILLAAAFGLSLPATAEDFTSGSIRVSDPWSRATAPAAPTGAAYMTIRTTDGEPDRLVSASSPVAELVELHTVGLDNSGIMRMRRVEVIEIEPESPTQLAPGGLHVMLIGLDGPLIQGDSFPVTLTFETAGDVEISVAVASAGASGPPDSD